MDLLREIASQHILLWIVPASAAILVSAIGGRVSRRVLSAMSIAGLCVPFLQSLASVVFFMWGAHQGFLNRVEMGVMSGGGLFAISFVLEPVGAWATLLATTLALAVQVHAVDAVSRLVGRHRFHALIMAVAAAGGVLFTAASPLTTLFGWESLALAGAFMAGFWESEEGGERIGMRWLLFQRTSGVLLLLGFLALELFEEAGVFFILGAVCVRLGQLPFHGWIPDSTRAPASATALVHGLASLLAGVYILDKFWPWLARTANVPELVGIIGAAGVGLGILAGLQQHRPAKTLGWMFMLMGGLTLMCFAIGDPAGARMLTTGAVLTLGGQVLAIGRLTGPLAETENLPASVRAVTYERRSFGVLAAAMALPPSMMFVALGRFCGSAPAGTIGTLTRILTCLALFSAGWISRRLYVSLQASPRQLVKTNDRWSGFAPAMLGVLAFALGLLTLFTHSASRHVYGNVHGLIWAFGCSLSLLVGWLFAWWLGCKNYRSWPRRLTTTQYMMDKVAGTGLGIGEMIVQLPILILRAIGVVFWRGIGDFILDTLIFGTAVRTVEGIGTALRYIQNGRIQRYIFVTVLATLLLVLAMLR